MYLFLLYFFGLQLVFTVEFSLVAIVRISESGRFVSLYFDLSLSLPLSLSLKALVSVVGSLT